MVGLGSLKRAGACVCVNRSGFTEVVLLVERNAKLAAGRAEDAPVRGPATRQPTLGLGLGLGFDHKAEDAQRTLSRLA